MSDRPQERADFSQMSMSDRVDMICDAFEKAWKAGEQPHIEDFLRDTDESVRTTLLKELLAVELEFRQKNGETVTPDDYTARFPISVGPYQDVSS